MNAFKHRHGASFIDTGKMQGETGCEPAWYALAHWVLLEVKPFGGFDHQALERSPILQYFNGDRVLVKSRTNQMWSEKLAFHGNRCSCKLASQDDVASYHSTRAN